MEYKRNIRLFSTTVFNNCLGNSLAEEGLI